MKLVTRAQMNQIDKSATTQYAIPSLLLMEHAAHEMYLHIEKNRKKSDRFLLFCGNGNNGGDGFALARLLYLRGYECAIAFVGKAEKLTIDAKYNYDICKKLNISIMDTFPNLEGWDVLIDCLFGTGLCRDIEGIYQEWIEKINASNTYIISVDIPSGVDSDNGKILGCAIKANLTYTMQCGKVGLYVYPGREYAGEVVVLDIFIPTSLIEDCPSQMVLIQKEKMKELLPPRNRHSNKGTYGKVLCIGGSEGMSGAISLAAQSALSAGCGLLTCAIPACIQNVVAGNVLESMNLLLKDQDGHLHKEARIPLQKKVKEFDTVLMGCGIGRSEDVQEIIRELYLENVSFVIDADALFALASHLQNKKNCILTPHLKEFANIMGVDVKEIVEDTIAYVDKFTKLYPDITLVLKSETTIIAQGEKRYFNTYGNNGLATGGSGDVLAGLITGLYAQNKDAFNAAVLGVFLHAVAADTIIRKKSVYSLLPSDIIKEMENVLFEMSK